MSNPDTDERVARLIEHLKSNPVVCVCKPFCVHWEVHAKKVLTPLLDSQAATSGKFPKPSRGPRGLLNEYECGCQVRRDASGGYFIHMCPIHNAASDTATRMREACVDAFKTLRATPHGAAYNNAINDAIHKIESLTLEQGEQEKFVMNQNNDDDTENYAYAVRLATVLQKHYYGDTEYWQPLPTLNGVLSQIDNMIAGLLKRDQKPNRTFRIQEANGPF